LPLAERTKHRTALVDSSATLVAIPLIRAGIMWWILLAIAAAVLAAFGLFVWYLNVPARDESNHDWPRRGLF
jgi:hypothetical protein